MIFNRSCREVHRLVAESFDRDLPLLDRIELRLHLSICINCTRFKKQMTFLRASMRALASGD
jgi:hypothetical protein